MLTMVQPFAVASSSALSSRPMPDCRAVLLSHHQPLRFLLEIPILGLFDGDAHPEYRSALELPGRFVFAAHRVAAVETHAQAVPAQRELAGLGLHGALRDQLIVDVELGGADRFALVTCLLPREFDTERVLAFREVAFRHEVLLRAD